MSEDSLTNKFYYPYCQEYNCSGVLLIKNINDNFSLDYECEENIAHQRKNIYFKTFERFYLKEKEIIKCSKCNSTYSIYKCKICGLYYCLSCSIYDAHKKENKNKYIINSNECSIHNKKKEYYCINCHKHLCDSCTDDEKHKNHKIKNILNLIPSKNKVDEVIDRLKYYDELIKLFEKYKDEYLNKDKELNKNITFNKKFENLLKNIIDEKNLIKKITTNFNRDFISYAYNINFEEIYIYTKTFNNDYLVDFYKSDSYENKTRILSDYFFTKKEHKIESYFPYLKKIYEKKIIKINDVYYLNCISLENKFEIIKYDKNDSLLSIKESEIEIRESIQHIYIYCENNNEEIYKIYVCLYHPKVIIFEFDIKKNLLFKNEDEIFYEKDRDEYYHRFIKCIELSKSEYIATATTDEISLWVKKNDNSKGYYEIRLFNDINQIQDILLIDDEYFVASTLLNQIIFYNKNTYSKDKTIVIKYSSESSNNLYLYNNYLFVVSRYGIGLISIKTKELVEYYNYGKNIKHLNLCFNNDKIYILTEKLETYNNESDDSDNGSDNNEDESNINNRICICEYKMISGDLERFKMFYPSNSDIAKNEYSNLDIEYLNSKNLLLLGNNVYKMEISPSREYYDDIRKSHITKSGKCIIRKKIK